MTESASTSSGVLSERPLPATTGPQERARAAVAGLAASVFALGLGACTLAVAVFVVVQRGAWPPHEDETLALFVGRGSLGSVLDIVTGERGGAPLHFLLAWAVAHAGGGLPELRLLSGLFAVASVPVLGLLVARITDRLTGLVATALASASWVLLFHGIYGRMYSLFLFTSALSYLALLAALERGGRRRFALWGIAALATVGTHPYGALVLGSQALYVLLVRRRVREALVAFGTVVLLAIPFWRADLVLAGRFDVGVGGGGAKLDGPLPVLRYLRRVAGDFTAGYPPVLAVVLGLAAWGLWLLVRRRRGSALLVAAVFATPTLAFLLARLGSATSPETRHLVFALPFFSTLVALPLAALARRPKPLAPVAVAVVLTGLLASEVAWARHKTPPLFTGEPRIRVQARAQASTWLAETGRPDDVLFGYDPLFLGAWERNPAVSRLVVPRADATLALHVLDGIRAPLGRGVWVLDASDTNNYAPRLTIPRRLPAPSSAFEARVFGPFLVVRSRGPTNDAPTYLTQTAAVQAVGQELLIGDSDINLVTARVALRRLGATLGRR